MNEFVKPLIDFFTSGGFSLVLKSILFYLAILWIAIIIWVTKDINNRTRNIALQTLCILLVIVLTPIFGLLIYLIVRPVKTLSEQYYEETELEILNKEEDIIRKEECFSCHNIIQTDYVFCPFCRTQLKKECGHCHNHFLSTLALCPYCGQNYQNPKTGKRKKKEEKEETV